MGLSRRQFTWEFKLAAVRHVEQGIPVGGKRTKCPHFSISPKTLQKGSYTHERTLQTNGQRHVPLPVRSPK